MATLNLQACRHAIGPLRGRATIVQVKNNNNVHLCTCISIIFATLPVAVFLRVGYNTLICFQTFAQQQYPIPHAFVCTVVAIRSLVHVCLPTGVSVWTLNVETKSKSDVHIIF
jgi:hypothetical protein